jgi:hypothetical protein
MMQAFLVRRSLVELLRDNAAGRYNVRSPQRRKDDAGDILKMPQVVVRYRRGNIDEHSSSVNGPYQHEATIAITILCGAVAEADLDGIENPDATPDELAAIMANITDPDEAADEKAEEIISLIFDIIMRPQNRTLGMEDSAGRWIPDIQKYDPMDTGEIVIVPATITLTYQTTEYTTSEVGVPGTMIDSVLGVPDTEGDPKIGVEVDYPING